MQPLPPASFPKRVKRFQSYSMTPMDSQIDTTNQLLSSTTIGSNKFNWLTSNKKIGQQKESSNTISVTNQISNGNRAKLSGSDRIKFKHFQKNQLQTQNKDINLTEKIIPNSDNKTHRKMFTSDIFLFSSMIDKNTLPDQKSNKESRFKFKTGQRLSFQSEIIKKHLGKPQKKDKQVHIPNFLLNKRKQVNNGQKVNNGAYTERQMCDSMPVFTHQNFIHERRANYKKLSIENGLKTLQKNNLQSQFQPPSNQKIAFCKATASTLCTNLPRQQSRRTFKDFEQMYELKEIQNSMEESDNIKNEIENLFKKEQCEYVNNGTLENQIAELFSDEDLESEEFNEQLQNELEDLF